MKTNNFKTQYTNAEKLSYFRNKFQNLKRKLLGNLSDEYIKIMSDLIYAYGRIRDLEHKEIWNLKLNTVGLTTEEWETSEPVKQTKKRKQKGTR